MASGPTQAFAVDQLKAATGQATTILTTTPLAAVYARLVTTTPTSTAAGTAVSSSGTAYAPVDTKGKWGTPTAGDPSTVANNAEIDFGTATAAWGTIVGVELWTAISGGTRLLWGTLTTNKSPTTGDPVKFAVGALVLSAGPGA